MAEPLATLPDKELKMYMLIVELVRRQVKLYSFHEGFWNVILPDSVMKEIHHRAFAAVYERYFVGKVKPEDYSYIKRRFFQLTYGPTRKTWVVN